MNRVEEFALEILKNEDKSISVRKAGSYRFPANCRYIPHRHVEYEVNYLNTGKCVMTFGTEYIPLKKGECVIVTPQQMHGFLVDAGSGCKITQAEISIRIPKEMKEIFPFSSQDHPYYIIRDCEEVIALIEQVAKFHRSEREGEYAEALLNLAVVQLLVALGYHTHNTDGLSSAIKNESVQRIMEHIQKHYDEEIRLEDLAKKHGISSRYLRKYFYGVVGMSCSDYLTLVRINKAKALLWETQKSVTEVAMMTGYGTTQYFSRVFKDKVGMTPGEYRTYWKENAKTQKISGNQEWENLKYID